MTEKQEQTELGEIIKTSDINLSIEQLKKLLYSYQHSKLVIGNKYTIQLEFIEVLKILNNLENQLEEIIHLSEIWELK